MLHDGYNYYSYNASSKKIELVCTVSDKLATIQEAKNMSGITTSSDNPNKVILKSELRNWGCRLKSSAGTYLNHQGVKYSDIEPFPSGIIVISRSYTYTSSGGQLEFYCSSGGNYISSSGLMFQIGFWNNEACSGAPTETRNLTLLSSNSYHISISRLSSGAKIEG